MRIGMVCPYSFDVPGGVQAHVLQLAEVMRERGHDVSVLAPASPHVELPDYVVSGGKAVPIPYNGSVARLRFGPATHRRVKRWLSEGDFDVLHLHEPNAPSLSMLALMIAEGPIVATFHTSTTKSFVLGVFQGILRPWHEKIVGRIAVSDLARRWQMEALGSDAVEIPNGVDVGSFASAPPLPGYPDRAGPSCSSGGTTSRAREWRFCSARCRPWWRAFRYRDPDRGPRRGRRTARGGRGSRRAPEVPRSGLRCREGFGAAQRGCLLRAQHRRGELRDRAGRGHGGRHPGSGQQPRRLSSGAGRRHGRAAGAGGDSAALAEALIAVLGDAELRAGYVRAATAAVGRYDWSVVADQIMRVYETVAVAGARVQVAG